MYTKGLAWCWVHTKYSSLLAALYDYPSHFTLHITVKLIFLMSCFDYVHLLLKFVLWLPLAYWNKPKLLCQALKAFLDWFPPTFQILPPESSTHWTPMHTLGFPSSLTLFRLFSLLGMPFLLPLCSVNICWINRWCLWESSPREASSYPCRVPSCGGDTQGRLCLFLAGLSVGDTYIQMERF